MAADGYAPRPQPAPVARQRILMTADTVGGVWQYSLELAQALIASGHEVVLASMGRLPSRDQCREAQAILGLELHARPYKLLWMPDCWGDVDAASQWLLDLAAAVRPSVVHLNDFGHGALPWPAPVLTVAHSCVLSWWQAVHAQPAPQQWQRYKQRVGAALAAADLVVAPSRAMLIALVRHYGPFGQARVIANGRTVFSADTHAKLPCVFAAARVDDEAKNMRALSAAAAQITWPVCVAGSAQRSDGSTVDLRDVHMLGCLSSVDVRRWLARAAICAHPARYEPFGLSVLEAALAGCALVLGDIDSLRENWDGAAQFVHPDDHDALAHALARLIADKSMRERQATQAQLRAQRFTAAAMVNAYTQAYTELRLKHAGGALRRTGTGGHG